MLRHASGKTDRLSRWALAIQARRGANVAAVALANKLARIIWAVLARDRRYRADWRSNRFKYLCILGPKRATGRSNC